MSDYWIRASEISEFVYCQHSWWLKRSKGLKSANSRELTKGTQFHQKHGRMLAQSMWIKRVAYLMLFCLVTFITFQILTAS
ncbi:MAG: hypothetical protein AAF490_28435 [Chloroflexota bacterium]